MLESPQNLVFLTFIMIILGFYHAEYVNIILSTQDKQTEYRNIKMSFDPFIQKGKSAGPCASLPLRSWMRIIPESLCWQETDSTK